VVPLDRPGTDEERRALDEADDAERDSTFIRLAIADCHGITDPSMLNANDLRLFLTSDIPPPAGERSGNATGFSGLDRSILHLDWRLKMDRWRTYKTALVSQSNSWWVQFALLVLGGLSTIFVAMKSMEKMKDQFWVGLVAVMFSASGTSVAGWNAFLAPAAQEAAARQRLATLRGIHQKLVQTVTLSYTSPLCPIPQPPKPSAAGPAAATRSAKARPPFRRGSAVTQKPQTATAPPNTKLADDISKLRDEYLATLQTKTVDKKED
jgi:hypothetical protein